MLDEMKIINSSDSNLFPIHPQTETSSQTLSGPKRVLARHCPAPPRLCPELSEARIQVPCVIHLLKLVLAVKSSSSMLITFGALLLDD
jgi:hypothetical protein